VEKWELLREYMEKTYNTIDWNKWLNSVEGRKIFAFESFNLVYWQDQYKFYQKFRKYKDPSAIHAVDRHVALRLQREQHQKSAKLYSVKHSLDKLNMPKDLSDWLGSGDGKNSSRV
jgi:hypothetical protein